MILAKILSGAQTGVDKAALDVAVKVGVPFCRYTTKGGFSPDDKLDPPHELETSNCEIRIENNVVVSDATLILNKGQLTCGTKLSYDFAVKHYMPCLIVQLDSENMTSVHDVRNWIRRNNVTTLNIAGPRESKFPDGIYRDAYLYLEELFTIIKEKQGPSVTPRQENALGIVE